MKKVKRFPGIVISFSYLKDSASTAVKRGTMVLTGYVKGVPFGNGRYTKEGPFLSKMVCKVVRGWTSGRNLLVWNFVEYPPPPPPPPGCIWKLPRLPLWLASEFITLLQLNEIFLHWCYFPPRKLNLSGKACLRNRMHGKRWKSLFVVHWKELFPMSSGRTLTKASKMRTWNFLPI